MISRLNMSPGPSDFSHLVDPVDEGRMFPHWSVSFRSLYGNLVEKLRIVLGTANPVLPLMTSGTGAIEALLVNALSIGDRVLVLSNGFFGDRLHRMALSLGLDSIRLAFDWEYPIDPERALLLIRSNLNRNVRAVLMVHLETSTGILNQLAPIGQFLRDSDVLFLVDAVASVGTSAIEMDQWAIDGLAFVSYKGLRSPPGLSMVAISENYMSQMRKRGISSYSLNLTKALQHYKQLATPSTAPVNSMVLLHRQLEKMLAYGLQNHYTRCREQAAAVRDAVRKLGLEVFGREGLGNCITTVQLPPVAQHIDIVRILETRFHLYVGIGLGKLHGSTFRLAHYGNTGSVEIRFLSSCLERALQELLSGGHENV